MSTRWIRQLQQLYLDQCVLILVDSSWFQDVYELAEMDTTVQNKYEIPLTWVRIDQMSDYE